VAITLGYTAGCEPAPTPPAGAPTMRAVVYTCYGGPEVLQVATVARPVPADDQLLVRVRAASVNPLDWHYLRGAPYLMRLMAGIGRPADTRLGVDFAGTVEAVGSKVTRFRAGDAVFGGTGGAFAEYAVVGADRGVALKPDSVGFDEAAAVPVAAVTALQALRDIGHVQAGDKVLVNGASGGVGPFAVMLAKYFGAEVTGVASGRNGGLVRDAGADHFIDYTQSDYTDGDDRYDVIIDNVGNRSLLANADVLQPDGVLVIIGGRPGNWIGPLMRPLAALFVQPFVEPELKFFISSMPGADMEFLAERLRDGSITPIIDRHYRLDELPDAIGYSEEGHARAKIIVDVVPVTQDPES
jgi:NADPH:quinone reductase-like Zn-dependent oxidoreductase